MDNVGLRWYKCDSHLHTMASRCYKNKEADTINDWIEEVKNKGLWGIGKSYTWKKMSQPPDLESVRQALISDDMRVPR